MVLPTLVRQAIQGRPLTVFGDGTQSRCFSHVSDVVRAMFELSKEEQALGGVFNIGSDQEISILELARRVLKLSNSSSEIQLVPYEEAYGEGFEDMPRRVPDISRIQQLTGYHPTHTIDEIIQSVIDYHVGSVKT